MSKSITLLRLLLSSVVCPPFFIFSLAAFLDFFLLGTFCAQILKVYLYFQLFFFFEAHNLLFLTPSVSRYIDSTETFSKSIMISASSFLFFRVFSAYLFINGALLTFPTRSICFPQNKHLLIFFHHLVSLKSLAPFFILYTSGLPTSISSFILVHSMQKTRSSSFHFPNLI